MLKTIIFTSLLVCVAIVNAVDTSEHLQQEHHKNKNKHHLQHSKKLEEHKLESLEHHEAEQQHPKHKDHAKTVLSKSEHGAKHHMQHSKVKTNAQAPRRVRKPQREDRKKKSGGKVKHTGAGEARTPEHKRKHAKRGHDGQPRAARGHKGQH